MLKAFEEAQETMNKNYGGPFGSAIVDRNGEIISIASNTVLKDHNPTAHGEINAIIKAGQKLGTHDLSGCVLYTTAYPCPMCLSAIIWANIKKVYYGCNPKDAEEIGFRDDFIYEFIQNGLQDKETLELEQLNHEECLKLFEEYTSKEREIY